MSWIAEFTSGEHPVNLIRLFVLKTTLELLCIPFLLWKYGVSASAIKGTWWAKWAYRNGYSYGLLACVIGAILCEAIVYDADRPRHQDVELEFFLSSKYNSELDQCKISDSSWPQTKTVLLRHFEHAEYAWRTKDYKEVVDMLTVIKAGRDVYGTFQVVPSYVIANDLGCAIFKLQRNRAFAAGMFFQEARTLVPVGSPDANIIERNIQLLDQMVNTLD